VCGRRTLDICRASAEDREGVPAVNVSLRAPKLGDGGKQGGVY
jgi:hypothetical protein